MGNAVDSVQTGGFGTDTPQMSQIPTAQTGPTPMSMMQNILGGQSRPGGAAQQYNPFYRSPTGMGAAAGGEGKDQALAAILKLLAGGA